ncbi:MAG: hypothetical protein MPK09_01500 [Gammaproteobacteria bacterium]|nr:hypothetical protein [Gammaproteobacteria bacterium]
MKTMNFIFYITLSVAVFLLAPPPPSFAHPGRTASDGAHYCRTRCDHWGVPWNERHSHGTGSKTLKTPAPNTSIPTCKSSSEKLCFVLSTPDYWIYRQADGSEVELKVDQ